MNKYHCFLPFGRSISRKRYKQKSAIQHSFLSLLTQKVVLHCSKNTVSDVFIFFSREYAQNLKKGYCSNTQNSLQIACDSVQFVLNIVVFEIVEIFFKRSDFYTSNLKKKVMIAQFNLYSLICNTFLKGVTSLK